MTPGGADTAPELGWTSSPGAGRRFPKQKVTRLLCLTQDHHRLHRRVQQDVILGGPRPDIRRPIPPRCMLGIAKYPGHAYAEMTRDIAAAIPASSGSTDASTVRSGVSVATQIPSRNRRGAIIGSPCNGSSLSKLASARPRMARASASLAAPMANRADTAQRASRSAAVTVLADSLGGTLGSRSPPSGCRRIAGYLRAGIDAGGSVSEAMHAVSRRRI